MEEVKNCCIKSMNGKSVYYMDGTRVCQDCLNANKLNDICILCGRIIPLEKDPSLCPSCAGEGKQNNAWVILPYFSPDIGKMKLTIFHINDDLGKVVPLNYPLIEEGFGEELGRYVTEEEATDYALSLANSFPKIFYDVTLGFSKDVEREDDEE